jgi:hypothetical protein
MSRLGPTVSKPTLVLLPGLLWVTAGSILLTLAVGWLRQRHPAHLLLLVATGVVAALLIHHFGFLRIVDRNLGRILPGEDERSMFSFMPLRSYLLIALMMAMGFALRHSPIPKAYLAVLYLGIGLALLLSSVRYLRVYLQVRRT